MEIQVEVNLRKNNGKREEKIGGTPVKGNIEL